MTRAVITLSKDLRPFMPELNGLIDGCGYSPESNVMGFSYKGLGVIVEANQITINGAEDEATTGIVMKWFLDKLNGIDQKSRSRG